MSKVNLGRVGFVLKGDYDAKASYKKLDCVKYNLNSYGAKQDVPAGKLPTDAICVRFRTAMLKSGESLWAMHLSTLKPSKNLLIQRTEYLRWMKQCI